MDNSGSVLHRPETTRRVPDPAISRTCVVDRPLAAGTDLGQPKRKGKGSESIQIRFECPALIGVDKGQQLATSETVPALAVTGDELGFLEKVSRFGRGSVAAQSSFALKD